MLLNDVYFIVPSYSDLLLRFLFVSFKKNFCKEYTHLAFLILKDVTKQWSFTNENPVFPLYCLAAFVLIVYFYLSLFSNLLPTWHAKAVVCYQFSQFWKSSSKDIEVLVTLFLYANTMFVEELVLGVLHQPFPLRLWVGSTARGMLPSAPLFQEPAAFRRKGFHSAGLDPHMNCPGLLPPEGLTSHFVTVSPQFCNSHLVLYNCVERIYIAVVKISSCLESWDFLLVSSY